METIVINFFGGPGSGKSTLAASIFAKLKWSGINCELVTEYAKDKVWEKSFDVLRDQIYVSAKQNHRLFKLNGQVSVIITDSPLLLGIMYDNGNTKGLEELIFNQFNTYHNINFLLNRKKKYNPKGRTQTLDEAKVLDDEIKNILDKYKEPYHQVDGTEESVDSIVKLILKELDKIKYRDKLLVITGPSGVGKTTLSKSLLKLPHIRRCITSTTREPRGSEIDGIDYKFLSIAQFSESIEQDRWLEWEEVYTGKYYGSSKYELELAWKEDRLPVLTVDVKGAQKIKEMMGDSCLAIYLDLPEEELKTRLIGRGEDSPQSINTRLARAKIEGSTKPHFDHVVDASNLDEMVSSVIELINKFTTI